MIVYGGICSKVYNIKVLILCLSIIYNLPDCMDLCCVQNTCLHSFISVTYSHGRGAIGATAPLQPLLGRALRYKYTEIIT